MDIRFRDIVKILVLSIIIFLVVLFFYKQISIKPLVNEGDYEVYSGRNVYEYWRSTLSDNQKVLYDEFKEGFLQFKDEFISSAENISVDEGNLIMSALQLDHPEIFWMSSYRVSKKNDKIDFHRGIGLTYSYNKNEAKATKARIEEKVQPIIDKANTLNTEYKKVQYVHDKLIEIGNYNYNENASSPEYQSIVSIFNTGETVCAGFSYGFKFIMDKLEINSIIARDISHEDITENHMWNMVKVYGKWYNIDITNDNKIAKDNNSKAYNYFLIDSDEFYKTHKMPVNIPQN